MKSIPYASGHTDNKKSGQPPQTSHSNQMPHQPWPLLSYSTHWLGGHGVARYTPILSTIIIAQVSHPTAKAGGLQLYI